MFDFIFSIIQGFNCADLRNVCTEAGMFAIRAMRDYVVQEDFMKVRLEPNCHASEWLSFTQSFALEI